MKLNDTLKMTAGKDGHVWHTIFGQWRDETEPKLKAICEQMLTVGRKKTMDEVEKQVQINDFLELYKKEYHAIYGSLPEGFRASLNKENLLQLINDFINFFSEFSFEPNFRFANTFCNIGKHEGPQAAIEYVCNYFSLSNNPYLSSIQEKTKSYEFQQIAEQMIEADCTQEINTRFEIFYGSQGTGKTTDALKLSNGKVMVCHSAMLPSDLMEDFTFVDGKATFKPSALQRAIVNGETITLDEINLLPFESLRFLQSLTDNKPSFEYKGQTINVKQGFKIIGTMNLVVNGSVFSLPEPLVDRLCNIKKYSLTAEQLLGAIL